MTKQLEIAIINAVRVRKTAKEVLNVGTEAERQDTRKAMAFDLCNIIDEDPSQETYTKEEIKKIIRVYVTTADQK